MLILFDSNRRICLFLELIFGVMAAVTVIAFTVMRGGAFGRGDAFGLYVDNRHTADGEEAAVYVCAEAPLAACGREGGEIAVALQFSLCISEGWSFGDVMPCEGAEGMTVTVGRGGDSLRLLIDGRAIGRAGGGAAETDRGSASAPVRLLRITVVPKHTDAAPCLVRLVDGGSLYYMEGSREASSMSIFEMETSTGESDDIVSGTGVSEEVPVVTDPETEADTVFHETVSEESILETEEEPPPEPQTSESEDASGSESEREPEPDAPGGMPFSEFVGCQETAVRDGEYAVRFLFFGSAPVVCTEGGGCLRAEVQGADSIQAWSEGASEEYTGGWTVCIFRGLRAEGRYTFFVYTECGVIRVRYADGRFEGYEKSRLTES